MLRLHVKLHTESPETAIAAPRETLHLQRYHFINKNGYASNDICMTCCSVCSSPETVEDSRKLLPKFRFCVHFVSSLLVL